MTIRNLTEADYGQVMELYAELDEFHVRSRPGPNYSTLDSR